MSKFSMITGIKNTRKYGWLIFLFLLYSSCQTIELENLNINSDEEVQGKLVLPSGSNLDLSRLLVVSNIDESPIRNANYRLEKNGKFTGLYVTNSEEEVVMMGFQYPGNPTNEINSTTTALGMILTTPLFFDLSEQGMLEMINFILNHNSFPALKTEIEKNIIAGKPLFDIDNRILNDIVGNIITSAGFRIAQAERDLPVNLFKIGRNFTINNSGKSFSTVVGIYKDDVRVRKITVDGINFIAGSLSELVNGIGQPSIPVTDHNFNIPIGNGNYTFKFRTGRPGSRDNSREHNEAFEANLVKFTIHILSGIVPNIENCYVGIASSVINTISSTASLSSSSSVNYVLSTVAEVSLGNISSILNNCYSRKVKDGFFKSFLNQLKFLSISSSVLSTGVFGFQWSTTNPIQDICYLASEEQVIEDETCGNLILGKWVLQRIIEDDGTICLPGQTSDKCGVSNIEWTFRSDGTFTWYEEYNSGNNDTMTGSYRINGSILEINTPGDGIVPLTIVSLTSNELVVNDNSEFTAFFIKSSG